MWWLMLVKLPGPRSLSTVPVEVSLSTLLRLTDPGPSSTMLLRLENEGCSSSLSLSKSSST